MVRPACMRGAVVGLLFSRVSWASSNCAIEDALIRALEEPASTYPVFAS